MKKWRNMSKVQKAATVITGVVLATAVGYCIYRLGKHVGLRLGSEIKANEINKISEAQFDKGFNVGYETGYTTVGTGMDISSRTSFKTGLKQGIEEGLDIGRRNTLKGLSSPDLSNPDQIKLAVESGVLLKKVGKDIATEAVKEANPELEFENFLKSKVTDSYNS